MSRLTIDAAVKAELVARMRVLLDAVPALYKELPEEWLYLDEEKTMPAQMTCERMSAILARVGKDAANFWKELG